MRNDIFDNGNFTSRSSRSLNLTRNPMLRNPVLKNPVLKKAISELNRSRKELADVTVGIKKALENIEKEEQELEERGNKTSFFSKIGKNFLPVKYANRIFNQNEALAELEEKFRECINRTQASVAVIAEFGIEKREELDNLRDYIDMATKENQSPQELQQRMAEMAGIEIHPAIKDLLDLESKVLTSEVKEGRRKALMQNLKKSYELGERLMDLFAKVGNGGLIIFEQAICEFYQFIQLYEPIGLLRKSIENMSTANEVTFLAKDALMETLQKSIECVALTMETAKLFSDNSFTSIETEATLDKGIQCVTEKVRELLEKEAMISSLDGGSRVSQKMLFAKS